MAIVSRCLSFYALRLLITPLVSFGNCIVCPYALGLDYSFGIFWPLYCLSFYALRLLITPLVSFGHCIVCPSTLYGFSLQFGIFWPLYCLSFYALRLLITPLVSFGHCIVCQSTLYGFSLLLWYLLVVKRTDRLITKRYLWYLLAIVLSVLLRFTASHYSFGIFWPLYCQTKQWPKDVLRFTDSYNGIQLILSNALRLLITEIFCHCIVVLLALRLLITPLVSFGHCIVCPSTLRLLKVSFGNCIVCPSTLYGFSLLLWYLLVIVLSVLRFTASQRVLFGIFWSLYCLSFYALRLLITLLNLLDIVLSVLLRYGFSLMAKRYLKASGQTMQWPKDQKSNEKRVRQNNGQKIPKVRLLNTMAKRYQRIVMRSRKALRTDNQFWIPKG